MMVWGRGVARVLLGVLTLALLVPTEASAQRRRTVRVRVVDIAGERAYLEPGAEAGVHEGARVRFARRYFRVIATTNAYAVIDLDGQSLELGARGTTRRARTSEEGAERLPTPPPLESYEGQWSDAERPASRQRPRFVPLRSNLSRQRVRLLLRSSTGAQVPIGASEGPTLVKTQLRAQLNARLSEAVPIRLSADAALQLYFGDLDQRRADASRPLVLVRQLQLSYGEDR